MPKTLHVTIGNVTIPVYYTPTRASARSGRPARVYQAYTAILRDPDGTRRRIKKSDYTALKADLQTKAAEISRHGLHSIITDQRRAALALLEQTAEELNLDPITLCTTAKQLIQDHRARSAATAAPRTVRQILDDFLADLTRRGVSKFYTRDITTRLTPFAAAFNCPITSVTGPDIATWLRARKTKKARPIGPRTYNNYRAAIQALAQFAIAQRYLPPAWSELDAVKPVKIKKAHTIQIFTVAEITTLLTAANDRLRPFLLLGAFAGIRHEEIKRITWANIRDDKGHITLPLDLTKTERKRLVPILPNLREWLLYFTGSHGPVCTYKKPDQAAAKLAKRCGLKWKRNALRHSFISYRVASLQSADQVALEAGNSVQEIHDHYLELVTPDDARAWFAVSPKNVTNGLLQLKFR